MSKFAAFLFLSLLSSICFTATAHAASSVEEVIERALTLKLHERKEWLRLGHYSKDEHLSNAANPFFYADPHGQKDPRAELIATLKLGFSGIVRPAATSALTPQPIRCQFPARWKWLERELAIDSSQLPAVECAAYEDYKKRLNAGSVTMVFSGYYVNNPSSVFGHLLMKINNKDRRGSGADLLDYGINYGAEATTENPVLYAIYGMLGIFRGNFAMLPYHYKVREYSDSESRDLWEYELALTPEELERLVDHLWEMASTHFDYYYFTQNCAYHLLAVLEAAAPRFNLLDKMYFLIIPVDGLKAIAKEPELVAKVNYRPSALRQLMERFNTLSVNERKEFLRIRASEHPEKEVRGTPEEAAHVLDTVLDDIDFRYFRELNHKTNEKVTERKQNILQARAKLPMGANIKIGFNELDRPERSHPSMRWGLAGGSVTDSRTTTGVVEGEWRFAFHSLYDPLDGHLPYANIESWRIRGRYYPERGRFDLHQFVLADVSSLLPVHALSQGPAWRVAIGLERVRDRRCNGCLEVQAMSLGGVSFEPLNRVLVYGLVGPMGEASPSFDRAQWIASLTGRLGARMKFTPSFQLSGEGDWRRVFDRETFDRLSASAIARYDFGSPAARPWALEAELTQEIDSTDIIARFLKFY